MSMFWSRTTIVTPKRKKPDDDSMTGWTILGLIVAVIGGVANGWGGAAIGFLAVCFLYGVAQAVDGS